MGQILGRVKGYYDRGYRTSGEVAAEAVKEQISAQERGQRAEKRKLADDARRRTQGRPVARRRPTQQATTAPEWDDELGESDLAGYLFCVRRIFNSKQGKVRSFRLSHPIRAELEIAAYGRENLIRDFCDGGSNVLSLPQLTFIDAFGVYRNMYRSLTGCYTPSNFSICFWWGSTTASTTAGLPRERLR